MDHTSSFPASAAPIAASRRWWVLAACVFAAVANNLVPPPSVFWAPEAQAFNAGWALYGFWMSVITFASLSFVLAGGVLGDIFGRRRMLLIGLGGLIVGNLVVLLTPSLELLISVRIATGIFAALVMPLSLSLLYLAFDDDALARARAIMIYVFFTTTAFLLAGLLGQLIYQILDWRATFMPSLLLACIAVALVLRETSESALPSNRRFDVVGHAAWTVTVLCALFSLFAWLSDRPYANLVFGGTLVVMALGIGLLVWWDYHTPDSIFGQSQLKRRSLIILIIYGLCMQFGNVALVTQVRNVLQAVYGYGVVLATVALAPYALGMLVTLLVATRRIQHANPRPLLVLSLLTAAGICAVTGLTRAAGFYPWLAVLLFLFGGATMLAGTVFTFAFFIAVPGDALGVRTGMNSSARQLGGALGNAVPAGLLVVYGSAAYERLLTAAGVPPEQMSAALGALNAMLDPASPGAALYPEIGERLLAGYQIAYLAAYERVLLISAVICLAGAVLAWAGLPRPRPALGQGAP